MPSPTLNDFHRWLLAGTPGGSPFIILHRSGTCPTGCATEVARHLNEFDDDSGGSWFAPGEDLVFAIAADPAQRRLLGVSAPCPNCPPTGPCGLRKVIAAIAGRGHVVFDHPLAIEATARMTNGYRTSVGLPPGDPEGFHIILNPDRFPCRCLAPLVADSFLEWSANRSRQPAA